MAVVLGEHGANCPRCGKPGAIWSPDYGRGAEMACYEHTRELGSSGPLRWVAVGPEARAASELSRAQSRANAAGYPKT
jgi:hypothetical protein